VRRRAQPHDLGPEVDRPVVAILGGVVESDEDRHAGTRYTRIWPISMQFPCNFRAVNRLQKPLIALALD